MPTGFESSYHMGICERLIYSCLPVIRHHEVKSQVQTWCRAMQDLESGTLRSNLLNYLKDPKDSKMISNLLRCRFLPQGYWPARLERFWNQKRTNVFALRLVKILIKKDESWRSISITEEGQEVKQTGPPSSTVMQGEQNKGKEAEQGMGGGAIKKGENELSYLGHTSEITSKAIEIEKIEIEEVPLLIAARNGIEEIVWEIIKLYPHAVEKLNDKGQSIVDVAVIHRQKKIFKLVKHQKIPLARLRRVIDNTGNTLLHHVADMEHYRGGTKPGPALKLQEELRWFEQVQKVIPSHYVTLRNDEGKTAEELFKESHQDQLKNAQKWIKETTQSCSTVAALVATVVFAAAYTVPGGSDKNGTPNFINSPYFVVFTISDVVSLASSLTSLVVFLSLLTSPFEQQEFHISLPRKLVAGFTFLFFAVITTMLSFGATILILIQSEKKLTTLLLSIAAFLPVLVFAIMQFRLYISFMGSTFNILKKTRKARTPFLVPCLPWGKMVGLKKKEKSSAGFILETKVA
ncbi:PREDICTED: ankyrin repeat-containing protein At3g12360-like isoform X2 [Populus euphratica]|uniref:Ankyrin repeat-containing protein At3g12360-like isoform X2 n=1 Tax=Populus euphratica TaxID=75702 RepID=A0AAJ6XDK7_POPEU|nr:PREDICTED: ankyrin repeat-containing protein At3g12360-like isoform X2 [Populus euphratica]